MLKLELRKKPVDTKSLRLRSAVEADYTKFLAEPFEAWEDGKLKIVYLELSENLESLRVALERIEYMETYRQSGLKTTSRIFGYSPRMKGRRDYCTASSLAVEQPKEYGALGHAADVVSKHYRQWAPELFEEHAAAAEKVLPVWRIGSSPFTSGIVNENNPLKYHFDAGNFVGVWSGMLVFKRDIAGGFLSLPEYEIGIELKDRSLLLFDGQGILHGVTPIKKLSERAKRYSVVYYSLQRMWQCLSPNEEITRYRKVRDELETRRATRKGASA